MSKGVAVSVVIPVYNGAEHLEEAVASVRGQALRPLEIVIVDDGSTDDTSQLVQRLHEEDIVYLRQDNHGPAVARNRGIAAARGAWIAFLDCDDVWTSDRLANQWELVQANPDLGLIFGDFEKFGDPAQAFASMFDSQGLRGRYLGCGPYLEDAFAKLLEFNSIGTPTVLVRKDVLVDAGGFDEDLRYVEDRDLWLRIAVGHRLGFVPGVVARVRRHRDNTSRDQEAMARAGLRVLGKTLEFAPAQYSMLVRRRYARAARDFGYFLLCQGRNREARPFLLDALVHQVTFRSIVYLGATVIGLERLARWRAGAVGGRYVAHASRRDSPSEEERRVHQVLMFSSYFPPHYSGAAKQAIALAIHLRRRGHYVEFVTIRSPGLPAREMVEGFQVERLEPGRSHKHRELRLWWNLWRYVRARRHAFDVIHSHGAYYTNSIVGPFARAVGWGSVVKASLADNDLHGLGKGIVGRLHRSFLRRVDAYVATSHDLREEFLGAGLLPARIHHLSNGVDTDRFRPPNGCEKEELRRSLRLPNDRTIALAVGVFDQRKNLGWLMKEWARGDALGTEAFLVVVGPQSRDDPDGEFIGELEQLAASRSDILCLVREVEEIEIYYRAADVFVLPSHEEGMPNVLLEAMASGLPCVATTVSGTRDLIVDGKSGYTFTPDDVEGLQGALQQVLASDVQALGERCREQIMHHYSLTALAKRYEALYEEIAQQRMQPRMVQVDGRAQP